MDIALATCAAVPDLAVDEQLLMEALRRRNLLAGPLIWSSVEAKTTAPKLCVLRSTWDYHLSVDAFLTWAEGMASRSCLLNPFSLVRWNAHKGYLVDLANQQVPIVPTLLLRRGERADLAGLAGALGFREVVVKPAVSANAHRTLRSRAEDPLAQGHLDGLLSDADVLVQPYLAGVESYGERSFIFIEGRLTHAVRRPEALVQGAGPEPVAVRVEPTELEAKTARAVLDALPIAPLYARIDLVPDGDGNPVLLEAEVIEPELFLREAPEAVERLAEALAARAGSASTPPDRNLDDRPAEERMRKNRR